MSARSRSWGVMAGPEMLIRARDEMGQYIGDDPSTPDVNEAWVIAGGEE